MSKIPIILIGGGGHCRSVIDVIESENRYHILGILDFPEKVGEKVLGYDIIGTDSEEELKRLLPKCENFLLTIGQVKSANLRIKLFDRIHKIGGKLPTIISPLAKVSRHAQIGEGTVVHHFACVNANAIVGKNGIINTAALVEHDAIIGDHCHIATRATANGEAQVKKGSMLGSHSCLLPTVVLPENSLLAAGSVLTKSPDQSGVYIGQPAKRLQK